MNDVAINRKGIRTILRSAEMRAMLERHATRIARNAGPGHETDSAVGRNRARASVIAATPEARRAEQTRRALTRALVNTR